MNSNIKKRILTSILLISLLIGMFYYSYIMIVSLIIISIISIVYLYKIRDIIRKIDISINFIRQFKCISECRNNYK